MTESLKPWARGPFELLKHAEGHLKSGADFDKRLALIGFDNAIEVSITAYLQLNPIQRNNQTFEKKDVEKWLMNYHSKLEFLEYLVQRSNLTMVITRDEIVWYHELRNQLYHSGNGMVPEQHALEGIRKAALWIFSTLYSADAQALLREDVPPPAPIPQPSAAQLSPSLAFLQSFIDFEKMLRQALSEAVMRHSAATRPVTVPQMWSGLKSRLAMLRVQLPLTEDLRVSVYSPHEAPEKYDPVVKQAQIVRNALIHGEPTDLSDHDLLLLKSRLDQVTSYLSAIRRQP